jgi:hypothetical protein
MRRINLSTWTSADKKPSNGSKVIVCDADSNGFCDYEFEATFDGENFIVNGFGVMSGITFWKYKE